MHVRNTHAQKFTQTTLFRSFFYANYPNASIFPHKCKKNAPEDAFWGIQHSAVSIQRERSCLFVNFIISS